MDKTGIKLSKYWTNRKTIKSPSNQQQSTFFYGSSNLIKSRFFTILVVTLISIISLNLILSLWIIHSLQIANGGLGDGNLLTTIKRMTVKGQAKFNGWLTAEEINPVQQERWLSIVGSGDELQLTGNDDDELQSKFTINQNSINYHGPNLIVNKLTNGSKQVQFSINSNQLTTNSLKELKSTDWGLVVDETLETSSIKGDHYHDLRLESRMKGLTMEALSENLDLRSKGGHIDMDSLKEITLSAFQTLKIDSSRIQFKSLIKSKTGKHTHRHQSSHSDSNGTNLQHQRKESTIAYQLCTCENGRLFFTHGERSCYLSPQICSNMNLTQSQ